MTPTRLLIGQILVDFAIVVIGLWAATEWATSMLACQPLSGAPRFTLGGLPLLQASGVVGVVAFGQGRALRIWQWIVLPDGS